MKSIKDFGDFSGKRVLIRADLDVPFDDKFNISDTFRLDVCLPTLNYVMENGGYPVICGHIGRPKGRDANLSTVHLKPYFDLKIGEDKYSILENLRFDSGEEENSETFAGDLAKNADVYVNECFSTSHRAHASIVAITKFLPSFAGIHLSSEVEVLSNVLKDPKRPLVAIIGGTKLETKKPVISAFLEKADKVLIAGRIGLDWNEKIPDNLVLPLDYATEEKDLGKKTLVLYEELISSAETVVWAGPIGLFEEDKFEEGTRRIGEAIVNSGAYSVVGGGDTVSALHKFGIFDKIGFVSVGGGAMLEFLSKQNLPGLIALNYNG